MLRTPNWQLQNPLDAVVFDCDGTLSAVEGIDELAKWNGVGEMVAALTAKAMSYTGLNPDLYRQRLDLVKPSAAQLLQLSATYQAAQAPDSKLLIKLLQRLNKAVYLVSAGLKPSLVPFGTQTHILVENIYGVDIEFDDQGHYLNFDAASPLAHTKGKREIVRQLQTDYASIAHIGDGINDVVVRDLVTRFIGYGGAFYRKNIAVECEFYLTSLSFAGLLPLLLTEGEIELLLPEERELLERGLRAIEEGKVLFG